MNVDELMALRPKDESSCEIAVAINRIKERRRGAEAAHEALKTRRQDALIAAGKSEIEAVNGEIEAAGRDVADLTAMLDSLERRLPAAKLAERCAEVVRLKKAAEEADRAFCEAFDRDYPAALEALLNLVRLDEIRQIARQKWFHKHDRLLREVPDEVLPALDATKLGLIAKAPYDFSRWIVLPAYKTEKLRSYPPRFAHQGAELTTMLDMVNESARCVAEMSSPETDAQPAASTEDIEIADRTAEARARMARARHGHERIPAHLVGIPAAAVLRRV